MSSILRYLRICIFCCQTSYKTRNFFDDYQIIFSRNLLLLHVRKRPRKLQGLLTSFFLKQLSTLKQDDDKYQFQTYLYKIRIVEHGTTLTRLRTGFTYLTTDTGRITDTIKHERICPFCNDGVEDTNHFLFQCNKNK